MGLIEAHHKDLVIEPICREQAVAPASWHEHAARLADASKRSPRAQRDDVLRARIERAHAASFGLDGTRKICHQLRREETKVANCTVERLMRAMGLAGISRGRKTITTVSKSNALCPFDKVNREFKVTRPNVLWVVDFTYVHTWAGFVKNAGCVTFLRRTMVGYEGHVAHQTISCTTKTGAGWARSGEKSPRVSANSIPKAAWVDERTRRDADFIPGTICHLGRYDQKFIGSGNFSGSHGLVARLSRSGLATGRRTSARTRWVGDPRLSQPSIL